MALLGDEERARRIEEGNRLAADEKMWRSITAVTRMFIFVFPDVFHLYFKFDRVIIDWLKDYVPWKKRSWNPGEKRWEVHRDAVYELGKFIDCVGMHYEYVFIVLDGVTKEQLAFIYKDPD